MARYDHRKIEKKWQEAWAKAKLYRTPDAARGKKNRYLLVEFPYPSGNLHVGHWYAFAVPDILARASRMRGYNVLYPFGFDAFGLPAENAAIKHGVSPRRWTEKNIAYMEKQIASMGASFDWSREVKTIDPGYYKWTQWMFLQFFKQGLAYRKETAVNWCPKDKTVLANEQVVGGRCERCDSEVEQRRMLQWNLRITQYADRLADDLEPLDWPREIKESQRNWIGRSEGAEIDFPLRIPGEPKRVVILHGRASGPKDNFYPWLKAELEKRGYEVEVPKMPGKGEPDADEQAAYVIEHCTLGEDTAIVGHSFGGVVALRLLERGVKAARVTLVAAPFSGEFLDGKKRKSVTAACRKGFDFDTIRKNAKGFVVLPDAGDPVVPAADAEAYAKRLGGLLLSGRGNEGHFSGAKEEDVLLASAPAIRVFTTRADTLFGATYLVLAPEHPWLTLALSHKTVLENHDEVAAYVAQANKKTELERQAGEKEKTGVELKGVRAVNLATGEEIPVFAADYVLGHYGTGAVMAVPAHDERDFAFAKKYDLPIREVVEPLSARFTGPDAVRQEREFTERNAVEVIVKHWTDDTYLCMQWKQRDIRGFVTGGIEAGEDARVAAVREVREETGFKNLRFVRTMGGRVHAKFSHLIKNENVFAHFQPLLFELVDGEQEEVAEREKSLHEPVWVPKEKVGAYINRPDFQLVWRRIQGEDCYPGEGLLAASGEFSGMASEEARAKIGVCYGRLVKQYRLRDWIVSRQRYWGVPIPVVHCPSCGAVPVPEKELPVKLPEVKDYLPDGSGRSPLAKAARWKAAKCPRCKGKAERETDTLDTFVDSSWYFLRYLDPANKKVFADKKRMAKWMPVDLYSGGAEHTTMHLLYSRFWHKALYDLGLVRESEPYLRRMNRSIILGPDGQKMSKSRGNVIDPDEVVKRLGADTVRLYLAFIGPYNEVASYPWNPDGVAGVRRFLERVWRLGEGVAAMPKKAPESVERLLHKTVKKVGEDIEAMKFNTAISALMIFLNAAEKEGVAEAQFRVFLRLLAPFAPHVAEELWQRGGKRRRSIHVEKWPAFDKKLLVENEITIAVQVNGKTRGEARIGAGADKQAMESAAREAVAARLEGAEVLRVVVVPGRLVNFVVREA